ncbi:class I SAM-dependent methyltransferase [Microtetraspora glauca]|uniref:Class I SAM-dependent methyltransferase n=1 Tax=Microtetraspora glauca TaxID=1996 RepID=A0ABV3GGX4_MICGL
MTYEHPLAYVLGLEGIALMRSYTGEHDRAFVEARLAEIRTFLDDDSLADTAVEVARVDTVEGYRIWAQTYDGPNTAFDLDEPFIREIVDALPVGDALDAACGTGRMAAYLAGRGHRVRGVDLSPDMLERARQRVPQAEFRLGDLSSLPVPDASVDLVVCSLALTHVPVLDPVLSEFARVLRPGGGTARADRRPGALGRVAVGSVRPGARGGARGHRRDAVDAVLALSALASSPRPPRSPRPRGSALFVVLRSRGPFPPYADGPQWGPMSSDGAEDEGGLRAAEAGVGRSHSQPLGAPARTEGGDWSAGDGVRSGRGSFGR